MRKGKEEERKGKRTRKWNMKERSNGEGEGEEGRKRRDGGGLIPSQTTNAHVEIGNPLHQPWHLKEFLFSNSPFPTSLPHLLLIVSNFSIHATCTTLAYSW